MKLLVRASILSLAVAGLVAGFTPHHSAQAQNVALSHQVASGMLPFPACPPNACNVGGIR